MYLTIRRVANKFVRSFFKRFNCLANTFCGLFRPLCSSALLFEVINGESVIYLTLYKHARLTITTTKAKEL